MSTGIQAAADDTIRAYRWLAATRRLAPPVPGAAFGRGGRQGAAQGRLRALAAAMQSDQPGVRGHADRVGSLSGRLALAIGLTPEEAEVVALAGVLHDIGTLAGARRALLHRRHAAIGAQLVEPFDCLALAAPMIRHHHERLDGSGYPDGLRGATIPVGARIIAVADAYDRLTTGADAPPVLPDAALVQLVGQTPRMLDGTVIAALFDLSLP